VYHTHVVCSRIVSCSWSFPNNERWKTLGNASWRINNNNLILPPWSDNWVCKYRQIALTSYVTYFSGPAASTAPPSGAATQSTSSFASDEAFAKAFGSANQNQQGNHSNRPSNHGTVGAGDFSSWIFWLAYSIFYLLQLTNDLTLSSWPAHLFYSTTSLLMLLLKVAAPNYFYDCILLKAIDRLKVVVPHKRSLDHALYDLMKCSMKEMCKNIRFMYRGRKLMLNWDKGDWRTEEKPPLAALNYNIHIFYRCMHFYLV